MSNNIIKLILDNWERIAAFFSLVSLFLTFGFKVFKWAIKWSKKIKTWIEETDKHRVKMEETLLEFGFNGGNSFKDKLVQIGRDVDHIKGRQTAIIQELPVAMFENNESGVCVYVNRTLCELLGLERDDSLGTGWTKAIHRDNISVFFHKWDSFIKYGKNFNDTFKMINVQTSEVFEAQITATKVPDKNGEIISIVGSIEKVVPR